MCDIDQGDGEYSQVWVETPRKARKSHICNCCGISITKGETYLVHFSAYDGHASSEKMCGFCRDRRETFSEAHGGHSCAPSFFRAMLVECIQEGDEESKTVWCPMLEAIRARNPA